MAKDALFELRRRTFDTPRFRGIEFIESEAKSILNHVPGNRLPFNWTINPYRGCSHSCSYCLEPETPVLMADGRTKPIKDLAVGDSIYGTAGEGALRRYVETTVLAHWETRKRGYRISLTDGSQLVSSGDHRYLSSSGWRAVAKSAAAIFQALSTQDALIGPGRFIPEDGLLGLPADNAIKILAIDDLGVDMPMFDITTGTGDFIANGVVSHNCFARVTHTYLDMNAGSDFDSKIVVKVNAPELLRKELRAKRWKGELVAMGTSTDPYQRAEGKYELMPKIIEALTEVRNPFSILTKGTLILRDLDLLAEAASVTDVTTSFSIGTFDDDVWAKSEPGTPHPRKRMAAVKKLNEAGIPCGVLVAPILPGLSDSQEQLKQVIDAALDAGAIHIYPILLHLRPVVREEYMGWLQDTYPELVGSYEDLYRGRAYAASADKAALDEKFKAAMAGRKVVARRARPERPARARAEIEKLNNQQLTLI